jgi:type IV secretion system protein VirD4
MKKQFDIKKLVLLNLPYLLMGLFATNFGEAWRLAQGANASEKFLSLFAVLPGALQSFWPSLHPLDLLVGLCCGAGLRLAVYLKSKNAKKYRHGMEYGSARWGTHEDIAPYIDPVFQNNVILTQTERLTMSSRPKNPKYARNKNVLVIGGSGSGKTRFWLKPNLMQMHSSYVVTDPKGTILVECGKMLQRGAPKLGKDGKPVKDKHGKIVYEPYQIKVLNTINFKKSMHYNPFSYIHSEKDILKLVTTLIANTKGEGKAGDDFWVKAETLLYCALIGYIHYEAPVEEQNFSTLIEMINSMEVREDDEEFKNAVDLMFDELKEREPNHFAVRQYVKYKLAAGKTAKSILVSCGARLAVFDIAELREVTSYDELELDTLGDRRTALFLIMSDTDDSFNFLISMCYTQLFNLLCEKADDVYGGRLPVHVRCLIDECANIGQIPKLEKLVATIRSREISACLVLQAQSQLKAIYKDNADTIIGNMDSSIFLGGKEPTTLKELEAVLGKETIDTYNTGESRGRETSHSLNYQKLGKALMSQDELAVMDGGKCILQLRGVRPFLSDKYDITQHPNYKYTADADPKNAFDIEGYLKARLKLKPNQVCDVYEIDAAAGE